MALGLLGDLLHVGAETSKQKLNVLACPWTSQPLVHLFLILHHDQNYHRHMQ